jgi:S1-C subfamily serine protease
VIIGVDDQAVSAFDDLLVYLQRYTEPGDRISLHVLRDGEDVWVDVTLAERPRLSRD